jgi:hypothetical protein
MRHPSELTPDELATLRTLWHLYPDEALVRHDSDHRWLEPLVEDGYIETTTYDMGVGYRLAPIHAAGLARVVGENAETAARN